MSNYASNELVTVQPSNVSTVVALDQSLAHCIPGLESLQSTEKIMFKQKLQLVQILCCIDWSIDFEVIDCTNIESLRTIFKVEEKENCCTMNCVPQGWRSMSVVSKMDNSSKLIFKREKRCVLNCCLPCCCFPLLASREQLSVFSALDDKLLGVIRQDWSAWRSRFTVLDATNSPALKIEGPGCSFACGSDIEFSILSLDGRSIGSITKHFHFLKDVFTDFDNFTINFPRDLDVATKATLLGAVNLINFLFFQGAIRRLMLVPFATCASTVQS